MKTDNTKDDTRPMSLLSLFLSFIALFVISSLLFFPLSAETRQVFIGLDFIICTIFLLQLCLDLIRSTDRMKFMKRHWIDFLASIPLIEPLRFARVFSILRVILVLRSSHNVFRELRKNKHEATLASILLLLVVLLSVGSCMMLFIEGRLPDANIQTGADAIWWAFVTISTVGYGDYYPVSTSGRMLAMLLIICGVGLFGMISGLVTSMITAPAKEQSKQAENKEKLLLEIVAKQNEILLRLEQLEKRDQKEER